MRNSRLQTCAGVLAAAALCAAAQPGATQPKPASLDVTDAVARLTVIPEARNDIKVEILTTNPKLPLRVRQDGARTVIDGEMRRGKIRACNGAGRARRVVVAGIGEVPWDQMPQIVVRTPKDASLRVGGAVYGVIGRSASLELGSAGCGGWTIGDVAGALRLSQAGSGDTRAGSAGSARLRITGEGDITVAEVRDGLTAEIAGAGDITAKSLRRGPLTARIAGSGNVLVRGGHADLMTAGVAGSGNVEFAGQADSLKARITGVGDIRVRRVTGPASKAIIGSGQVLIGG